MKAGFLAILSLALCTVAASAASGAAPRLEYAFHTPPADARPWTYWFWCNGNVTREGITADLEAMKRVGIGGVLIMEVDQDVPSGSVAFMSNRWRELFAFATAEAARLGIEIDLNNDAGWTGSGGPWIDPENSMQKLVWTETRVTGPRRFDAALARPEAYEGFYRDVALVAFPTPPAEIHSSSVYRIDKYAAKSGLGLAAAPTEAPVTNPGVAVARAQLLELTARLHGDRLEWDVPPGDWTVLRFGHTSTGKTNYPSPAAGKGLEADKLSRAAIDRHFDAFLGKVFQDTAAAGPKVLSTVHVDSWEVGYQNWTPGFRAAFRERRGYDPLPWLPAFTGRVVDTEAASERFLWDVRRTISELLNENYATQLAERAHAAGRRFSVQGYRYGPFDCLSYAGRADLPVGEFWMTRDPLTQHPSVKTMSSAGHIYGKPIIAAEAFTATDTLGRQRNHPYSLKAIGDAAFCAGVNRFIFHRYALQPWTDDRKPGMTMGPWGVEYERTATWWNQTPPWHTYLTRCQYLLRQGHFVADLCYLQSEEGFNNPATPAEIQPAVPVGFDFDFCSDEVVRTRLRAENGRLVLPDGMSYRVLVLPSQRLMTPELLRKIRDLVRAGAVVYGPPPLHSPSLSGFPECDAEIQRLVAELWVDGTGTAEEQLERAWGHHKVLWGPTLEQVLTKLGTEPDFVYREVGDGKEPGGVPIRWTHRTLPDRELYFVANLGEQPAKIVGSFRAAGGAPELWRAEDGAIEPAAVYDCAEGRTRLPLTLGPRESVFVVFKHDAPVRADRIVAVNKDAATLLEAGPVTAQVTAPPEPTAPTAVDTFTLAAWVNPQAKTALPTENSVGTSAYTIARNDVLYPPPAHEVLGRQEAAGAGFAVGRNGVTVLEHGDHLFAPTLVYATPISDWTHVAVVFDHGTPTLYLNGNRVHTGVRTASTVYGGVGLRHGREFEPFRGEHSEVRQISRALRADEVRQLMREMPRTPVPTAQTKAAFPENLTPAPLSFSGGACWFAERGHYELKSADGTSRAIEIAALPPPLAIDGAWTLAFPGGWGAPAQASLPRLVSWTELADPDMRYFSGTGTYEKEFDAPAELMGTDRRIWLELGDVQVIAQVTLNGHVFAPLWKPPFRLDVTEALIRGRNRLQIAVTNLWVNRLIGDEQHPPDREWRKVPRRGGFALKEYPPWFLRGERSPVGRVTFTTWKHYEKDSPLFPSGLLGPVSLRVELKRALP